MARLIDADALLKSEIRRCGRIPTIGTGYINEKNFKSILAESPTVDAVEVVRCKNCVHYDGEGCLLTYGEFEPNSMDFCSYGERRNDG